MNHPGLTLSSQLLKSYIWNLIILNHANIEFLKVLHLNFHTVINPNYDHANVFFIYSFWTFDHIIKVFPFPTSPLSDFRFPHASTPRGCSHPQCGWRPRARPAQSLLPVSFEMGIWRRKNAFSQRSKTWKTQLKFSGILLIIYSKKTFYSLPVHY